MGGYPALGVGLDEAWDRATPDQVKAYGASFLCRYLGEDNTGKNLTRAEAEQLSAAGLWIVSNYEYHPGAALKGYAEGVRVAQLADAQHRACGGPPDRPIYFSVDIDITNSAQMAAVLAYFRGIASVVGVGRTGAYGEYDVIRTLFDGGLIAYGWQTYAWSPRGAWDVRAQIRQVANGISVSGHDVDRDENYAADYGQWITGGQMAGVWDEPSSIKGISRGQQFDDLWQMAIEGRPGGSDTVTRFQAPNGWAMLLGAIKAAAAASGGGVQATQEQVNAGVLAAMLDARVQKGIGDAIASHLKVS